MPPRPWWQKPAWLRSSECHHLCMVIIELHRRERGRSPILPQLLAAFLKPAPILLSGCHDGRLRLLDPASGTVLREVLLVGGDVETVAFAPCGERLACAVCDDGSVHILDPPNRG